MKKPKPKRKSGLILGPIKITEHLWYYEEPKGLMIVKEEHDPEGRWTQTSQTLIPWTKIAESYKRLLESQAFRKLRK